MPTDTFGGSGTWDVPQGVTTVDVEVGGDNGRDGQEFEFDSTTYGRGANGGLITFTMDVSGGETFYFDMFGAGAGGSGPDFTDGGYGGRGTRLRYLGDTSADDIAHAGGGGGGGGGGNERAGDGGPGGGPDMNGLDGDDTEGDGGGGGGGGTLSSGGAGGAGGSGSEDIDGSPGSKGSGGAGGGGTEVNYGGGGGGGGYYGGGGGASDGGDGGGGGGGGSGWVDDSVVSNVGGGRGQSTNDYVSFTYSLEPTQVTDLSASADTEDEVTLSWSDAAQEDNYEVFRAESSGAQDPTDYTLIDTLAAGTTTYTDTGLEDGERYFYRIRGTNSSADGDLSNEAAATTVLPAPSLTLDSVGENEVTVSWSLNDDSNDGDFRIWAATSSGQGAFNAITFLNTAGNPPDDDTNPPTTGTATFDAADGALDGEKYWLSADRRTPHTTTQNIDAFTATTPLPPPSDVSVSNVTADAATLSWADNADNEDAYRVLTTTDEPHIQFAGGSDEHLDLGTVGPELAFGTGDFTFVARCKPATTGQYHTLMEMDRYTSGFLIRPDGSEFQIYIDGSSWKPDIGRTADTDYTYIITRSGGTVELFVNGESQGTRVLDGDIRQNVNDGRTKIASSVHSSGQTYDGTVRTIQLYGVALSQAEREQAANGVVPAGSDLRLYFPMDQIDAGTVYDRSGYGNHGSAENGPTLTGTPYTDASGALAPGTTSYSLSGLLNGERYDAKVRVETDHRSAEGK